MYVLSWLFSFGVLASAAPIVELVTRDAPTFIYAGDAPYSVDPTTLAAALHCPNGNPAGGRKPVLLVHGTAASGSDTWLWTYVPALQATGQYTACYLELPNRAGVDMQVSAEYVAYGIHYMSQLSGGQKTAVITHSQGGPDTQWAFAYWPSTWAKTSYYLPLSPDLLGVTYAKLVFLAICPGYMCEPSIWQQLTGSKFLTALRQHNFKANVPSTLTWTINDEIVTPPQQNAQLPGGTTIGVQELCPGRVIDHIYIIADAVAYAIVTDALNNGGTGDKARILKNNPSLCSQQTAPGMNPSAFNATALVVNGALSGFLLDTARVPAEPPLMPYVVNN
ncbi:hypothetical protein AMS68_006307 [Peltaster fructicola]|uniref:AB hydrolase-1 domain-containing protein n=1 Tax=Peltaster fructicola TaxID=286661 RepID=A0A6H0Y2C6_9PEZI|nr:hypothetical protein AMS68_006307 [Peltaster fructicola]